MKQSISHSLRCGILCGMLFTGAARAATQEEINESVDKGLAWLATRQLPGGSWIYNDSGYYAIGATGLAVNSFIHHAKHIGADPFSDTYLYSEQVKNGLHFIFSHAQRDAGQGEIHWGTGNIYAIGPALMGITSSGQKNRVVDQPASQVHGMSYEQIAIEVLKFIGRAQCKTGHGTGTWDYSAFSTTGDMSTTGWVALGMGYAAANFDLILDPDVISLMSQGIDLSQWQQDAADPRYGGVGYRSSSDPNWTYSGWINIYKAGHLLYMMELCGDNLNAPRVQRTLSHIENAWNYPNSGQSGHGSTVNGYPDMGWKGGPWMGPGNPAPSPLPSYIATVSTMKAFVLWGVDHLGGTIDWFTEMTDIIVGLQKEDGSWDQGGYPSYYPELSTIWALLTTQRAVPSSGSITDIRYSTANFHATAPSDGTGYFVVVERGEAMPSPAQIKTGQRANGQPAITAGQGAMVADTEKTFPVSGLSAGNRYDLYFVHQAAGDGQTSPILRVQFATLNPGSMLNVTEAMSMSSVNWALNMNTGALNVTYRIAYNQATGLKQDLHTAFWFAIPPHNNWKLETVHGATPDDIPYTDVTAAVEAQLQSRYGRAIMLPGDVITVTLGIFSRDRSVPPIESVHAFWADPPLHPADLNGDGWINDFEMLTAVDEWKAGRMGDFVLIEVLDLWRASK